MCDSKRQTVDASRLGKMEEPASPPCQVVSTILPVGKLAASLTFFYSLTKARRARDRPAWSGDSRPSTHCAQARRDQLTVRAAASSAFFITISRSFAGPAIPLLRPTMVLASVIGHGRAARCATAQSDIEFASSGQGMVWNFVAYLVDSCSRGIPHQDLLGAAECRGLTF